MTKNEKETIILDMEKQSYILQNGSLINIYGEINPPPYKSRNRSGVNLHRFLVNYKWNIWLSLAIIVKLPRDRVKLHILLGGGWVAW